MNDLSGNLKLALPNKGALSEGAVNLLSKAGYRCKGIKEADLLQLYIVQGLTMADIAKKYGCAIFTIQKYFKKYNIQPRKKGNLILKEELEDLYRYYVMANSDNSLEESVIPDSAKILDSGYCDKYEWDEVDHTIKHPVATNSMFGGIFG